MNRNREGFTLVELMLSVAIMTSMMALVWGSFSLTARNRQGAKTIADRYQQVRSSLGRMSREISMAYLSRNDTVGTLTPRTLFTSKNSRGGDMLTFSTMAHVRLVEDAKEGDQSVVRYYVEADPDDSSRHHLWRRESRRLGGTEVGEHGPAYIVLEDIEEIHFQYFDDINNEWRDDWDTDPNRSDGQRDRLPAKVRIELTVLDEHGDDLKLITAARIFLRDPLWFSVSE